MPLLAVEEALSRMLDAAAPRGTETVAIAQAGGRIVASAVEAHLMQPPFDCSAMDGYALIAPGRIAYPLHFTVIGESAAGKRHVGAVGPGEAVRIFTGAPLPEGADTIVIQENAERDGDRLTVLAGIDKGRHIHRAGLDFAPGRTVIEPGRELDGPALSLAAASGHAVLDVFERPRVAILSTGDELVPPGVRPGPDQIVASNSLGIAEIVRRCGGEAHDLGIVADNPAATEAAIKAALESGIDVLVTVGGASVGDRDYVHAALKACGVDMDFWKIAMRPGKPLMYGRKTVDGRTVHVIGLPGNPVSSLVCSYLFLHPLLAKLAGRRKHAIDIRAAQLGVAMAANDHRRDYVRGTIESRADGALVAIPLPVQDSSMLSALTHADALIIRAENAPAAATGDPCRIVMLSHKTA